MAISPGLLQAVTPKSRSEFAAEADQQRAREQSLALGRQQMQFQQQAHQQQMEAARDEQAGRRRSMALSMLNGLQGVEDPDQRAQLYPKLRTLAQRYDPTIEFPEQYDDGMIKALYASQVSPKDMMAQRMKAQEKMQGSLPTGYRLNASTGEAELIPGIDPSYGKRGDALGGLMQVFNPSTGQLEFATKANVAAGGYQPPSAAPAKSKPLPASALKMQNEEMEQARTAGAINADIGKFADAIQSGDLDLGPVTNLASQTRNYLGLSSENSRNFASFRSALEKMRNDSLRLNKGVQTEGDAQRAWNELFQSINDEKVVMQRLEEIQAINRRAAEQRRMAVDLIRQNFGADPLGDEAFSAPAVTLPQTKPARQAGQRVQVVTPDGKIGTIDAADVDDLLAAGGRVVR